MRQMRSSASSLTGRSALTGAGPNGSGAGQGCPPTAHQVAHGLGDKGLRQGPLGRVEAGPQLRPQWLQVAPHGRRQGGLEAGEVLQVDIEVAHRPGDLLEPGEAGAEVRHHRVRQDTGDLGQGRPGAAGGHAQVVQELRIQVLPGPGDVDLHGVEQPEEDLAGGLPRRLGRVQAVVEPGAVAPGGRGPTASISATRGPGAGVRPRVPSRMSATARTASASPSAAVRRRRPGGA